MKYVLSRFGHAVLLLIGVSFLSFLFSSLAPGNYFDEMRLSAQISPETISALRTHYDLDRPLAWRYAHWLGSVARGDLGFSFAYNMPAAPLLWSRAQNTLVLMAPATLIAWLLALPIGIWSAEHRGKLPDVTVTLASAALLVIPDLLLALGLLLVAVRTDIFATGGMASVGYGDLSWGRRVQDVVLHMALPVTVLVLSSLPTLVRHIRAAVSDELETGFLRAARAHGIPRRIRMYKYALRAAANPLISLFGFSLGTLLSSSLMVEVVMSWPGLGPLLLEAILARDVYLVIGGVLLSTVFLVGGNLLADLLLYWADPRIRAERGPA